VRKYALLAIALILSTLASSAMAEMHIKSINYAGGARLQAEVGPAEAEITPEMRAEVSAARNYDGLTYHFGDPLPSHVQRAIPIGVDAGDPYIADYCAITINAYSTKWGALDVAVQMEGVSKCTSFLGVLGIYHQRDNVWDWYPVSVTHEYATLCIAHFSSDRLSTINTYGAGLLIFYAYNTK
jgi:hypothetical protein